MSAQRLRTGEFLARLAAIDPSGWPVDRQVDYHIVRAEMNGFDFDHRILRPWAKDACFYAVLEMSEPDVPARESPQIFGALCLSDFSFPLSQGQFAVFAEKLRAIPAVLIQARSNLTELSNDQRLLGIRQKRDEAADLARLAARLEVQHPDLLPLIAEAKAAAADRGRRLFLMAIYLNQPGYGTSYVVGKSQFEKLLADAARMAGSSFSVKAFLDDYFARGIIPASLIRWEMMGLDDEIEALLKPDDGAGVSRK